MDSTPFLAALASFFAIMNPIANVPLFTGLTEDMDPGTRRATALKAVLLAMALVSAFIWSGPLIFSLFGISLGSFRIAGGLLIAWVGFQMLQGMHSSVSHNDSSGATSSNDTWVSPLAIPILAGPGTIANAMSLSAHAHKIDALMINGALLVIGLITLIAFHLSNVIDRFMGENAMKVMTRLMGLILAVIGVEMFVAGTKNAWSLG
jgi:multiple antibiotic resistance protein